jgi:hypothetical protein
MATTPEQNVDSLRGRPLGRVLVTDGQAPHASRHKALDVQKERGGPLGEILVDMGMIDNDTKSLALAYQAGMESST